MAMTVSGLSRRGLLGCACGALACSMTGAGFRAEAAAPAGLIDTHHHILPPEYLARKGDAVRRQSQGTEYVLQWTPQQSLYVMDQNGVRAAVVSLSAPGVWFGDAKEAQLLSRLSNDYCRSFVDAHPDRFGFFAALPLPDIEGSLAEADRALDGLKADGVCLMTSYDGRYPGDPAFAPVFDALNRKKAVVYFHPIGPACCVNTVRDVAPTMLEFPFDTTRAIASLLYSGTFARCPDIRFIFSHGGGAIPFLASRLERWVQLRPELAPRVPQGPEYELKRLYFDTKDVTNRPAWAALTAFAGTGQVMFGSDYPYGRVAPDLAQLKGLGLSPAEFDAVGHLNAERLIPRLRHV